MVCSAEDCGVALTPIHYATDSRAECSIHIAKRTRKVILCHRVGLDRATLFAVESAVVYVKSIKTACATHLYFENVFVLCNSNHCCIPLLCFIYILIIPYNRTKVNTFFKFSQENIVVHPTTIHTKRKREGVTPLASSKSFAFGYEILCIILCKYILYGKTFLLGCTITIKNSVGTDYHIIVRYICSL